MFGIGMPELMLIVVVALIVLGPKKLPDVARAVAKGIIQFKRALNAADEHEDGADSGDGKASAPGAEDNEAATPDGEHPSSKQVGDGGGH